MYFKGSIRNKLNHFQQDTLPLDSEINRFQKIIDSGMLWALDNEDIVKANNLINNGYIIQRYK